MYYAVSIFLVGAHEPAEEDPIWQENIVVVEAHSPDAARARASEIGRKHETSYETVNGILAWRFHAVQSVCEVESDVLADGIEVFSRFLRNGEAISILSPIDDTARKGRL